MAAMPRKHAQASTTTLRNLFAKNLRLARIAAGMSQEELADAAELDRTFVGTVERAVRNISIDNVQRLSEAVRVAPQDLLSPMFAKSNGYDEKVTRLPRTPPSNIVQSRPRKPSK